MFGQNLLRRFLSLTGISPKNVRKFVFLTSLDCCFSLYILAWFQPAKYALMTTPETAYVTGLFLESLLNICVFSWCRRNWGWIRSRIKWNHQCDNRYLLIAIVGGMISTLDPVFNFKLILNAFPWYLRPVVFFLELYNTSVCVTTTYALLIVVYKTVLALADGLREVRHQYERAAYKTKTSISGDFFRLLETTNEKLHTIITVFHVFTVCFSVCMTGSRIVVLDRTKPGVLFLVIATTLNRMGYCMSLYHCGEKVKGQLVLFRRVLLREAALRRGLRKFRTREDLLYEVQLRREHSLALRVFNLPLCFATGLWFMSVCSTMVVVTIQFAVVICAAEGNPC